MAVHGSLESGLGVSATMEPPNKRVAKRKRTPDKPEEDARLSPEAVHVIAQSVHNLPPLSDPAAATLALDAEYRVRQIVQEGIKFMKHSKQNTLLPSHVSIALRVLNVEPVYGFGAKRRRGNHGAGAFVGAVAGALGKPDAAGGGTQREGQFGQVDGVPELFFVHDSEVSVKSLLQAPPPELPLEVTVNAHWLAVDGKQPAISQNPMKQTQREELESGKRESDGTDGEGTQVEVRAPLKHDLTRELQLYFQHVQDAIFGEDVGQLEACLNSISEDAGIAVLLPYLTKFVKDSVQRSIRDLRVLFSVMRLVRAMLENEVFSELERYLHQLLPAVMSCVVGKRLCRNPRENHWALRDYTAGLLREICGTAYAKGYVGVQQRIVKTFVDALKDVKRPLTTHYGAIVGITCLGKHTVEGVVVPLLKGYLPKIIGLVEDVRQKSVRREEGSKVFGALAWAVSEDGVGNGVRPGQNGEASLNGMSDGMQWKAAGAAGGKVSISRMSSVVPRAEEVHERLWREMDRRLYPFGESKSESELAVSLAEQKKAAT
ncbi:unnamed protein product [Chondrus crispus]|uniref:TATA box binding protein associated factor (TAF) histone-like fold domain-containing protein n=1 Tax=Chondrus crispus TaxID=2769 RepID=R7QB25_CHOCR|nr:unnamed protein product [Chondrus crispus]CDF35712.1 unnamed protein product [Chondrus crispus]|eukprot:XP_005715531.1 unnamed protein product [Chondrus crispus]